MRFRLVYYDTTDENKYAADRVHEYIGDREAIWRAWYMLARELKRPHVEVYSINGARQDPAKGIDGMQDYRP